MKPDPSLWGWPCVLCFIDGLNPQAFFIHAFRGAMVTGCGNRTMSPRVSIAGREALVEGATSTAQSGYEGAAAPALCVCLWVLRAALDGGGGRGPWPACDWGSR